MSTSIAPPLYQHSLDKVSSLYHADFFNNPQDEAPNEIAFAQSMEKQSGVEKKSQTHSDAILAVHAPNLEEEEAELNYCKLLHMNHVSKV